VSLLEILFPRGSGRAVALAVVVAAVLLRVTDPGFVTDLRLRGFDLLQQIWPRSPQPTAVALVEIDDKSLARYGQWPWPRSRLARLVHNIAKGKPAVLGIDIIFSEADRLSPPEIVHELPDLPPAVAVGLTQMAPSEQELAEAMRGVPTVLAAGAGDEPTPPGVTPIRVAPIRQAGGDATRYLTRYTSMLRPLPQLAAAARGVGSVAIKQQEEGVVRRVPLAIVAQESIFPALALEMLRIAVGGPPVVIDTGADGIRDLKLADLVIPTDPRGRTILHFSRPHQERLYSAADVLDTNFDTKQFRSQIVLLGVTGVGTVDQQETPVGPLQGIDVHAQLIESLLLRALLRRPVSVDAIEIAIAFLAGVAAIFLPRYRRPAEASLVALGIVVAPAAAELGLFRFASVLFDGTFPILTSLAAFGVMLFGNLRAALADLRRESELKQRLEGELTAAQAIQMGLLPRRFPAFPDRPDIDLYARIEPARMVGGDFYEYLLVDRDRRLFFLIADVSDKGIPAALFMAMTKEIVHDAVLRHSLSPSLERIFAEVNHRTTAASMDLPEQGGDMMFVTAFAGLLDLETGDLAYASAGHDLPFVIGGNPGLRRLETAGGPPLGAVDPFPFPIDRGRIEPGEILLLYTDGITEAQNHQRALYSVERLEKVLANAPAKDCERVIAAVVDDVRRFVGGAEQADDITLLAVRRVG
jgi:adenylate cyclase